MHKFYLVVSAFLLLAVSVCVQSHQLSTAYLTGQFNETGVFSGQWQVRLYDLEQAIGVDSDGDGKLRWLELQNRTDAVTEYLQANLQLARASQSCTLAIEENWKIDTHFNEGYLAVPVRAQCAIAGEISINYSAFFNEDNQHKLLFTLTNPSSEQNNNSLHILSDTVRSLTLNEKNGSQWATFKEFVVQGAVHIWIGYDHILFLLTLLLSSVLIRNHGQWLANNNRRDIILHATWIVTAFTIAHSITLTATALQWIQLPSRWVEVGIAVTVVLAALNNIFPVVQRLGWLTFGFGLLHGMGFAGALGELGLPQDQQFLTVLAFNLGVEFGQMAIVIVVLPLLILLRRYACYARYSMTGLSAVIVLVAVQWIFQRI